MGLPEDLAAREQRAAGVFLLMLGIGLTLDRAPSWLGWLALFAGAVALARGMLVKRHRHEPSTIAAPPETPS
jgi:hypothetical protein